MRCLFPFSAGVSALLALLSTHPVQAADSGVLRMFNFTDYTSPDMIKKFTAETGIKVTIDTYDSNETLLAKMKAGITGYDIVVPSNDFVPILIKQKLIQPVGVADMPNFHNLEPRWQHRAWDSTAQYTVPWVWGTTSFVYDTKLYPAPVDSLSDFFNPPAVFRGQVGQLGSASEVIDLALVYLHKSFCNEDPTTLKAVQVLLEAQKPFVKVYSSDGIKDRMVSGETLMHAQWSGDAERARVQKPTLRYVYAKEGGSGWMDNVAIAAGAPDLQNAKTFLNFMMDPKNAALQSSFTGFQNGVVGSGKFLDPELAKSPEFNPPAGYDIYFNYACSAVVTRDYDRIWTQLRK